MTSMDKLQYTLQKQLSDTKINKYLPNKYKPKYLNTNIRTYMKLLNINTGDFCRIQQNATTT